MLLKLYSIITGVSLVCGYKVSHDLLKDKEYVEQIKKTELGRKILNTFKSKLAIILKSFIPLLHIYFCFINSMYFILDMFGDDESKNELLDILEENK